MRSNGEDRQEREKSPNLFEHVIAEKCGGDGGSCSHDYIC